MIYTGQVEITRVSMKYDEIFVASVLSRAEGEWKYRVRVEIQSTSEMTPYFITTKCIKLFITYLTRSTECLPTLPSCISTISTISMTVVMTMLFNTRARCSVNINPLNMGLSHATRHRKMYSEQGRFVINIYIYIGVCLSHVELTA